MFEWFFSLALALVPPTPLPPKTSVPHLLQVPEPRVITARAPVSRRLRGDWQAPDVVFMGFTTDWSHSLLPIVSEIAASTPMVLLVAPDEWPQGRAWYRKHLRHYRHAQIVQVDLDSLWVRDYGPFQSFEQDGSATWLDSEYATDRPSDDRVPALLSRNAGARLEALPFRLDGGAILSNGAGLCISTLEAFENAEIAHDDPEGMDALLQQLGCEAMALLPALAHDETKHADMFAQFAAPDRVMVAEIDPGEDAEDAERMEAGVRALQTAAALLDYPLEVVRVPLPIGRDHTYHTYLNGLQLPDTFLAPSYHAVPVAREALAYQALSQALPGVEIVPIPADDLIELEGAIHCIALGVNR